MCDVPRELPRSGRPVWSAVQQAARAELGAWAALRRPSCPLPGQRLQGQGLRGPPHCPQGPGYPCTRGARLGSQQEWRGPPYKCTQHGHRVPLTWEAMGLALPKCPLSPSIPRGQWHLASHPLGTVSSTVQRALNPQRVAPGVHSPRLFRGPPVAPAQTCCIRNQMGTTSTLF